MNPEQNNSGYNPSGSSGDASSGGYAYGGIDVVNNSDYLGEIAAAPPPKQSVWPKRLAIIGGAIALFTAIVFIVMNAASDPRPGVTNDALMAYGRAKSLDTVTSTFQPYFDSSELRATSTELQAVLHNFQRNITVILEANGVRNPQVSATELTWQTELDQHFRDARILVTLDREYVSEITYQVEVLRSLIYQLENKLTVIDHRNFLSNAYEELDEVLGRMSRIQLN